MPFISKSVRDGEIAALRSGDLAKVLRVFANILVLF